MAGFLQKLREEIRSVRKEPPIRQIARFVVSPFSGMILAVTVFGFFDDTLKMAGYINCFYERWDELTAEFWRRLASLVGLTVPDYLVPALTLFAIANAFIIGAFFGTRERRHTPVSLDVAILIVLFLTYSVNIALFMDSRLLTYIILLPSLVIYSSHLSFLGDTTPDWTDFKAYMLLSLLVGSITVTMSGKASYYPTNIFLIASFFYWGLIALATLPASALLARSLTVLKWLAFLAVLNWLSLLGNSGEAAA